MKRILLALALLSLVLNLSSCANSDVEAVAPGMSGAANEPFVSAPIKIDAENLGSQAYGTNPLVVEPGAVVKWTNEDTISHTVTADDGSFKSEVIDPGKSFSFQFNRPGTYAYHCAIHGAVKMSGTVQVGPAPAASTPAPNSTSPSNPDGNIDDSSIA